MADVKNLTERPDIKFRREREFKLTAEGSPDPQPAVDRREEVKTLQQNFIDVSTKARKIHAEASKLAITRSIPVPERARDVRAAVLRQDEPSGGIRITFDLYQRSIDYLRRERNALPPTILDELTGDFVTDQKHLTTRIREITEDVGEDLARLLGSQIIILFILKLLQLGMDAVEGGAQSATKEPKGAAIGVVVANLALSIAAQQLYAGMNEEEIEDAIEQLGANVPAGADMQAAKEQLKSMPLFQAGLQALNPTDHRIIVDFVRGFLNRQTETGWETWMVADDLLEKAEWAENSAQALDRYVPKDRELTDINSGEPAGVDVTLARLGGDNRITLTPAAPGPCEEVMLMYSRALNALNRQVDNLGQMLGYKPDIADLCCFLNWLELQDADNIKSMSRLIDVYQKSLRKADSRLRGGQLSGQLTVSTAIHQAILLLLNDIVEQTVDKYKKWFLTEVDSWNEIMQCRLIDELVEYLVSSLEYLESLFVSFLDRYLGYIEDQEEAFSTRINIVGNWKLIRTIIQLMDQFLEFSRQSIGVCLGDDPTQMAIAVQQQLDGLGPQIAVPIVLGGNPYQTIQTPPLVLENGITMPSPAGQSAGTTVLETAQEVCRLGLVNQNLVPFPRA